MEKPPCDVCRALMKEKGKEPNCADCVPKLLPENEEAAQIYFLVSDQLIIAGMSGAIIGINHLAIHKAMELYNIEDKRRCFEKVIKVFREVQQYREEHRQPDKITPNKITSGKVSPTKLISPSKLRRK